MSLSLLEKINKIRVSGYFRIRWFNDDVEYYEYTEGRAQTLIDIRLNADILDIITKQEYEKSQLMEALQ